MRQAISNPLLLLSRDVGPDGCLICEDPGPCSCQANEICERTLRTCSTCQANVCVPNGSSSGGGISTGALAGAIVGVVLLLSVVVAGALFWRRRARAQAALEDKLAAEGTLAYDAKGRPISIATRSTNTKPSSAGPQQLTFPSTGAEKSPNPAQANLPSSAGADVRVYLNTSNSTINLGGAESSRAYASSTGGTIGHAGPINDTNPFSDAASVSTVGTNVIPIAFVPPKSNPSPSSPPAASAYSGSTATPARPARAPDLSLRLPPHLAAVAGSDNGAVLTAPKTPYARSTRSGVSGVSSRASTISSASSVLYDTPIVTSAKVGRQVLGVMRAEVVAIPSPAGSPSPSGPSSMLSAPSRARPSVRSPLAGIGFIPEDIEMESAEAPPMPSSPSTSVKSNPFDDSKSLGNRRSTLTVGSTTTFGALKGDPANLPLPPSAPSSALSDQPPPPYTSDPGHDYTPVSRQQPDIEDDRMSKRRSIASMQSGISGISRTDSILAAFPILPPTPSTPGSFHSIANARPYPSSGHGYTQSQATINTTAGTTPAEETAEDGDDILRPPVMPAARGSSSSSPSRRTLGLSTMSSASVSSNTSSGLEAFPFQFGSTIPDASATPSTPRGSIAPAQTNQNSTPRGVPADRASLDTIALSRDLEAYPLAYDR